MALHSTGATINFAERRLARSTRAWVARQDPLRANSPRDSRRHVRDRRAPTAAAGSIFLSTLDDAPFWLSLVLLVHEVATFVVPQLFALSIGTLIMGVLRNVTGPLQSLYKSWPAAPARVLIRVTLNVAVIITYTSATIFSSTPSCRNPRRGHRQIYRHLPHRGPGSRPRCLRPCTQHTPSRTRPAWTYGVGGG